MKVYIEPITFKCHTVNDGTFVSIETNFFDGKCDDFIEGYRYIPSGENWTRYDGVMFTGEMIAPWKDYSELDNAQREHEKQQLLELKNKENSLNTSYTEGVNSI